MLDWLRRKLTPQKQAPQPSAAKATGAGEWVYVTSSNIHSFRYDPTYGTLDVRFKGGGYYRYLGVPERIPRDWQTAGSKGKYHYIHIRDKYPFRKLG